MADCSIIVISKLGFLTFNLIFLSICVNLGGQDVTKMDSLSLKRKEGLEEGSGRSRILINSSSRRLILRTDVNLAHLLHQSEFLACAEALDALLTRVLRKDTLLRHLVHQLCLK